MKNKMRSFPQTIDRTREEDLLRLAILKESAAYRAFWLEHGGEKVRQARERIAALYAAGNNPPDDFATYLDVLKKCEAEFEITTHFNSGLHYKFGVDIGCSIHYEEALEVLNPLSNKTPTRIPFDFDDPAPIGHVFSEEHDSPPGEYGSAPLELPLKPSERLLKVDLSRKRCDLLAEFTRFLDAVDYHRQPELSEHLPPKYRENYEQWSQDRTRFVKEAWRHLEVWRLRRQRKPFFEICSIVGIPIDTAKKSFARAYELIEGHRYDPERYKGLYKEIAAEELRKTCTTCQERDTCTDPCPDVLAFIDQDHTCLYERLTPAGK